MHMLTRATMLVSLAAFLLVTARSDGQGKKTNELLGTWQAIRLEYEGETGPKEVTQKVKWIFKEEEYTGVSPEMDFKGRYTINPTKAPKEIDLVPAGGKKTMQAIYKLGGDQLTLCFGDTRPSEFVTKQGSKRWMYVLKRVKD
jgi:uncharacterized protein (TIGR03067 family)